VVGLCVVVLDSGELSSVEVAKVVVGTTELVVAAAEVVDGVSMEVVDGVSKPVVGSV
jgi:hypothetical protein